MIIVLLGAKFKELFLEKISFQPISKFYQPSKSCRQLLYAKVECCEMQVIQRKYFPHSEELDIDTTKAKFRKIRFLWSDIEHRI